MVKTNNKFILDACCGGRHFWINKHHPNCIYIDKSIKPAGHNIHRKNHKVIPDVVMDFRKLDFPDKSFKLVVFDPPHLIGDEKGNYNMLQIYGALNRLTWKQDIKAGFNECMRVLEDYGVLIFKWNESSITKKEVLKVFSKEPLFGHPTLSRTKSHWLCFMKIPEELK